MKDTENGKWEPSLFLCPLMQENNNFGKGFMLETKIELKMFYLLTVPTFQTPSCWPPSLSLFLSH